MRLAWLVFGLALACFMVFPVSKAAAAVAGVIALLLLPVLGYRDGTALGLRWALIVPAAAFVSDVLIFTPLTLQPDLDATISTFIALVFLPALVALVAAGIRARRLEGRNPAELRQPLR
jgi:hypothetical protein